MTIKTCSRWSMSAALLLLMLGGFLAGPALSASDAVSIKPHQAIVKINTYALNEHNELSLRGRGSGIIIDQTGLVLTNYHVTTIEEEFDGSLRETSFQICLTVNPNEEADCSYLGRMISRDKDLDVAILKLMPIDQLATVKEPFPYLRLDRNNSIATGNKINVLGYPSIGQETITNTEGIVSGKINRYKKDWLKTDAVISFGNSGGAGINNDGLVVGLTSRAHSDLVGSLGYLINISSLNKWIDDHLKESAHAAGFEDRIGQLSIRQKEIEKSDVFKNELPPYNVTKQSDWHFEYLSEDVLVVNKKDDDEGGSVIINSILFPVRASTDLYITTLKRMLSQSDYLGLLGDIKNTSVDMNGLAGDKVTVSISGETQTMYVFPVDNYILFVSYDYGRLDKDKKVVDGIINSLRPAGSVPYKTQTTYEDANPVMSLVSNEKWPIISLNSKDEKAELYNEALPNAFIALDFVKIEAKEKDLTNEEKLKLFEDQAAVINNAGSVLGVRYAVADSSAHFKLNDEINDAVMVVVKKSKIENDKLMMMMADHYYKQDDYYIDISFNMFTDSEDDFNAALDEVRPIMASLSLKPLSENPANQQDQSPAELSEQKVEIPAVSDQAPQSQSPAIQKSELTIRDWLNKRFIFWSIISAWALAVAAVLFFLARNLLRR